MTPGGHDVRPPSLKWPGSALLQSQGAKATLMRPRFSSGSSSKCAGLCFRLRLFILVQVLGSALARYGYSYAATFPATSAAGWRSESSRSGFDDRKAQGVRFFVGRL